MGYLGCLVGELESCADGGNGGYATISVGSVGSWGTPDVVGGFFDGFGRLVAGSSGCRQRAW